MSKYKSQWHQDKYLNEVVFRNLWRGTFVDIGAHDGIDGSNTYFMEKYLEWTGICIEANPKVYDDLQNNRKCITINCAAGTVEGEVGFTVLEGYSEMLSGVTQNYHPSHLKRISVELEKKGGTKKEIKVPARRVDSILTENIITRVHYMSIDVEGSEMDVLKSIDYENVFIDVLTVERNYADVSKEIISFLKEKGYNAVAMMGGDIVFIHKKSEFLPNINKP